MSREKKFSKGPWETKKRSVNCYTGIAAGATNNPKWDLATVYDEADANLISAAPELLDELEEADNTICSMCKKINPQHKDCPTCPAKEIRLAAIAKAYGDDK